jgi:iron-sulfur cluster repair protein YtfE (RIC family)
MTHGPFADGRDMVAVHTMFRREFGAAPGLVRAVAAGDDQRTAVVADHIALMSDVLCVHHSAEDEHLWPLPRARGTAEIVSIVRVMEEQHEAIHKGADEGGARGLARKRVDRSA